MQNISEFKEKQPEYRYFKINDERADVFIYKFIEEKEATQIEMIHNDEIENVNKNENTDDSEVIKNNDIEVKNGENNEDGIALLSEEETSNKVVDETPENEIVNDETEDESKSDNEEDIIAPTEEKHYTYIYKVNTFSINPNEVTEEMISNDPMSYLEYEVVKKTQEEEQLEFDLDIDFRVSMLELGI